MRRAILALALVGACGGPGAKPEAAAPTRHRLGPGTFAEGVKATFEVHDVSTAEQDFGGKIRRFEHDNRLTIELATAAPPSRRFGGVKARPGEGRVGCRVEVVSGRSSSGKEQRFELGAELEQDGCSFRRSPNGRIDDVQVEIEGTKGDYLVGYTAEWSASARLALRLASVPMPDRDVAPGESWSFEEPSRLDGFSVTRRATYTLVAWEGAAARVKLQLDEIAEPTDKLASANLRAAGELVLDPARALPTGSIELSSSYVHKGDAEHGSRRMEIRFR